MAIHTNAGSRFFISPTSVNVDTINDMNDATAVAFFEAISDWVEVEELEDLGELGDQSEAITFTSLNNARVRKLKGPRDAGTQTVVVGRDPLDDGQEAIIAAEKTKFDYPVKIILADARSASYSDSIQYYAGMAQGAPTNLGNVSNVVRRTFAMGINTAIYEVVSAALSVPVNTVLPSIIGSVAQVGVELTGDIGTYTNSPTSYAYQWQADAAGNGTFANISGATSISYTVAAGETGDAVRFGVTPTNGAGAGTTVYSLPTPLVIAA